MLGGLLRSIRRGLLIYLQVYCACVLKGGAFAKANVDILSSWLLHIIGIPSFL